MICRFFECSRCGSVLDLGCGNGFLTRLLALEGLPVTGVDIVRLFDEINMKPGDVCKGEDFYRGRTPGFINMDAMDIHYGTFEGVFLSWPDQGKNKASMVLKQNPHAVVYVMETTGLTGDKTCGYILDILNNYKPVLFWDNINHRDLESAIFHRESGVKNFPQYSHNRIILFLRRDLDINILEYTEKIPNEYQWAEQSKSGYCWETELDNYYKINEMVNNDKKILWKPVLIKNEIGFLRNISMENACMGGIVW